MHQNKTVFALVFLLFTLGAGCALVFYLRPHYIFYNETDRHEHDLALKMSLKLAEERSGIENALILLKQLPHNTSIEDLAPRIFEKLRIGERRGGKGILLLYSESENLFKIEVSYSLEGTFPDAICHQLEHAAQSYMMSDVPQDFLSELMITMNIHGKWLAEQSGDSLDTPKWMKDAFLSGGAGVRAKGYKRTVDDFKKFISHLSTDELARYAAGDGPRVTMERYMESLERGLGDPQLPLLTEGSRIFRMVVPRNAAQLRRIAQYYQKGEPHTLFESGAMSLVVFRAGIPNLPILMRRMDDGLWYVDEAKIWTYFHRFENGDDFFVKYSDMPFTQQLLQLRHPSAKDPLYADRVSTPPVVNETGYVYEQLTQLEQSLSRDPNNARLWAQLGELYLFEMGWVTRALDSFERASRLDPNNRPYHWRLVDLYMNNSEAEKFVGELKRLHESDAGDALAANWYKFYKPMYDFKFWEFRELRKSEIL